MLIYAEDEAEEPETLAELLAGRTGGVGFEPTDLARNHREHFARIMYAKRKEGRTYREAPPATPARRSPS